MKKIFYSLVLIAAIAFLSSCATIVGGNKYIAHVQVPNHPTATIKYNNEVKGQGYTTFKVKRTQANKLSLVVKEEGLEEQTFNFQKNTVRGWALLGTIVTWTGLAGGIPLP